MENRVLKIDLSVRSYEIEIISDEIIRNYLGGRGLGAHLLSVFMKPKIDPLSPENHLIFTAGPASGTKFPFSSKSIVTTKSPLTGIYLYSISSGIFAQQIRRAGLWAIDVSGVADMPVYIKIMNREVEFKEASSLWGLEPREAQRAMLQGVSPTKASTIAIGPGGEKVINYASIMADGSRYRTFARGGSGAVMGSKKLKGIVISGTGTVQPVDKYGFKAVTKAIYDRLKECQKWADDRRQYGTGSDLEEYNRAGILPTKNWQTGSFEDWEKICTRTPDPRRLRKNITCGPFCQAICAHYTEYVSGRYSGAHCDGPEYETIYAFGSQCGVNKFDAIVAANQICDEQGIDTMSAGVSIGFAMECYEKGLIGKKDTDGINLCFGNDKAMIAMLRKIANKEGFGRLLGEGVRKMAQQIPGSESFAMHSKGLELGGYECRNIWGQALEFAISNRGGCHHAYGLPARIEAFNGTGTKIHGKGDLVKNEAIDRIIRDSIPTCTFAAIILNGEILSDAISALSGESWSLDDFKQVGLRVICQERLFNMREGLTRKDDSLPARLLNEPKPDGPAMGSVVPLEDLKNLYYEAVGWDISTGNPTESQLRELGIVKQ